MLGKLTLSFLSPRSCSNQFIQPHYVVIVIQSRYIPLVSTPKCTVLEAPRDWNKPTGTSPSRSNADGRRLCFLQIAAGIPTLGANCPILHPTYGPAGRKHDQLILATLSVLPTCMHKSPLGIQHQMLKYTHLLPLRCNRT